MRNFITSLSWDRGKQSEAREGEIGSFWVERLYLF